MMTSSNLVGSSTGRSPGVNKEGRASEALGAHEAAEGVLGRAYDRLAAHVEAGVDQYGASGQPVKAAEQPAWEPRGGCRAHRQHSTVDRCRGPTSTYQKRDTKKAPGDSRQEWRLHCQIPHTENSSYLRNLAVGVDGPLAASRCQSAGWILLIHAGEFVARLAHYMQHLDSDHIRKYAAELCRMAVFGTLNPLTPARLQA